VGHGPSVYQLDRMLEKVGNPCPNPTKTKLGYVVHVR